MTDFNVQAIRGPENDYTSRQDTYTVISLVKITLCGVYGPKWV